MAIVAQVIDGKVVANYTDGKANKKTGSDSLNKDAFYRFLRQKCSIRIRLSHLLTLNGYHRCLHFHRLNHFRL